MCAAIDDKTPQQFRPGMKSIRQRGYGGVRLQGGAQSFHGEHVDGDTLKDGASDAADSAAGAAGDAMGSAAADAGSAAYNAAYEESLAKAAGGSVYAAYQYQVFLSKFTTAFGQRPIDLKNPELYDKAIAVIVPLLAVAWVHKIGLYEIRFLDGYIGRPW